MKNKFFTLSLKCLAFILALVMIVSCIPIVTFASNEEVSGTGGGSLTSTGFSDGVYTVTVDADRIYEMIDNGTLSRDALKGLIPQELSDALATDGGAYEKVAALLRAYLNIMTEDDPEKIYEILPVDMTIEYLTQGSEPLIWKLISREDFFGSIDLVTILTDMEEAGELSNLIDVNGAADIVLNSGMMDEATMRAILSDLEENDPAAYSGLVDEVVKIILNGDEFAEIRKKVIDRVLNDDESMEKLVDLIKKDNNDVLAGLFAGNHDATERLSRLIQDKGKLSQLIADGSIRRAKLEALIDDAALDRMIASGAIDEEGVELLVASRISPEELQEIQQGGIDRDEMLYMIDKIGGVHALVENDLIDVNKTINAVGGITVILEHDVVDFHDAIAAVGGAEVILEEEIFDIYDVIEKIGGASALLEEEIITNEMFEDEVSSLRDIVLRINTPRIVEIVGFTRIINAIGRDELVNDQDILNLVDYEELVHILIRHGYFKTMAKDMLSMIDKAALLENLPVYLINYSEFISVNGREIYNAYDPKIDVNLLTQVVAEAIPTFDKLARDPSNAFSFVIDWRLDEENIDASTTKTHYAFGFKVKVVGDTQRLANLCQKLAGYISVVNEGERTDVSIRIPAKMASLYLRAVNTDKLPEELKEKLLGYSDMEITEDNVQSIIADFTVEEIASIIEGIDFAGSTDVVEKMLELYSEPYSRALSMAKRAVGTMTYDKLSALADRIGVAKIEGVLENNEQKITELREKILEKIDTMTKEALIESIENGTFGEYNTLLADFARAQADGLDLIRDYLSKAIDRAFKLAPDNIVGQKLSDYYKGNGQFGPLEASFGFDVAPKIEQLLSSKFSAETVGYAMNFSKNTEITREVSVQVTVADVYEARFVNADGDVMFVTYLPVGADLSVIYELPALQGYDNEWTYDGENAATVMPARDIRLVILVPGHEHNMVLIDTIMPGCDTGGYEIWGCSSDDCHFEEKRNETAPLGHAVAEHWSIDEDDYPTKHSTGKAVKVCTREECGKVCEEYILPVFPDQSDEFYIVTLNDSGYCENWTVTYEFLVGTDRFTRSISANANHNWDGGTEEKPATIYEDGEMKYTCTSCGKERTEIIPMIGSEWKSFTDDVTGVEIYGCFADGIDHRIVVVPNVEYNASAWVGADGIGNVDRIKLMDISIADLSTDNYKYAEGLQVTIPISSEHRDRDLVVYHKLHDGTIEKFANYGNVDEEHTLTVVEIEAISGTIPAIRFTVYSFSEFLIGMEHVHEYGEWTVKTRPSFTEGGTLERKCETGNEIHVETVDIPHFNEVDYTHTVGSVADCVNGGVDYYTYTIDGQDIEFRVDSDPLNHEWGSWSETTAPTHTSTGMLTRVCSHDTTHVETYTLPELPDKTDGNGYVFSYQAPTCAEKGVEKYTYEYGGQSFTFEFEIAIDQNAHSFSDWGVTTKPDQNSTGTLTRVCSHDTTHVETYTLPVLPDKTNGNGYSYSYQAPTCVAEGVGKYTYVNQEKNINVTFEEEIALDPNAHSFGAWNVTAEPTKDSTGTLTRVCSNDTTHVETYTLPELPDRTDGNGYTCYYQAATCIEGGVERYTYVDADRNISITIEVEIDIDEIAHSFGSWAVTGYPTVDATGMLTRVCTHNAAHTETHELPALNKVDYTYALEKPTCTEKGMETYTYGHDGEIFTFEVEVDETGHSFGAWTVTGYPTKSSTGMLTRVCANNGDHTETHELPALPDKANGNGYVYSYKAPSCTDKGAEKYTYVNVDKGINITIEIPIDEIGHSFSEWTVTATPTKDATGKLTRVCAHDPTHVETHTLPKLNDLLYIYTPVSAATCTEKGSAKYTYGHDGQVFVFTVELNALQHSFGKWTVVTAPTLETTGMLQRACANDPSHKETRTIPKLNAQDYAYVVVTAPLCESKGVAKYSYTFAGTVFEFTVELAATGHTYTEWTVGVAPTFTEHGELVRSCSHHPEHKQTQVIPAVGEAIDGGAGNYTYKVTKEPTETEPGSAVFTYTVDGKTFEFVVEIPSLSETETDSETGSETDSDIGSDQGSDDEGSSWWIVILIVAIVLVLAGLFLVWWFFIKDKNDKNPPEEPAPVVEQKEPEKVSEYVPNAVIPTVMKVNGRKSIVNVGDLDAEFSDGDTVSLEDLKAKGIIPRAAKRYKVLADGTLNKALVVEADEFSPTAKEKILAAGGQAVKVRFDENK